MRQINPILMAQLQADAQAIKQMGSPLLQCQGMLVPRGWEHGRLLITESPRPIISSNDPAEVNIPGGLKLHVPGAPQTDYEGSCTILETEQGHGQLFAEFVRASGGEVDCDYYDGRPGYFTRVYEMSNCAFRFESSGMTADGRSQVVLITAPITYTYFGIFANIGTSNTVVPGQRDVPGVQGLIQRVQTVVNTAQQAVFATQQGIGAVNAVRGLFG